MKTKRMVAFPPLTGNHPSPFNPSRIYVNLTRTFKKFAVEIPIGVPEQKEI